MECPPYKCWLYRDFLYKNLTRKTFRSEVYCPSYRDVRFMVCPSYRDSTVITFLDRSVRDHNHTEVATRNIQWAFIGGYLNYIDVFVYGNLKQIKIYLI